MTSSSPGGLGRWVRLFVLAPAGAGLSAALSLLVPVAAPLLLPFAAARLARTWRAERPEWMPLSAALSVPAALLLGFLVPPSGPWLAPATALAAVVLPAFAVTAAGRDGRRADLVSLAAGAATGAGGLAVLLGAALATGREPGILLSERIGRSLPQIFQMYRSAGLGESSIATLAQFFEGVRAVIARQTVGLVLGASFLYGAFVVYAQGRRIGLASPDVQEAPFSRFRTPVVAAIAFVPLGAAGALGPPALSRTAIDLLVPLGVLFFLRGLAIIRALLDRGAVGLLGRSLVYVLVVQMPFPAVVALGGLFDEFFDFRSRLAAPREGASGGGGE